MKMSKEEGDKLTELNPAPAAERSVQTLEVPDGAPPAPESVDTAESTELAQLKAKVAELQTGNKAKDKALIAEKKKLEELQTPEDTDDETKPTAEELIAKAVEDSLSKVTKGIERKLKPLLDEAASVKLEKELAGAVKEFGEEAVTQHMEQAEAMRKEHGTLSLNQALKLVVPAQSAPQTTPPTNVEASRSPAPQSKKTSEETLDAGLAGIKALRSQGRGSEARAKMNEVLGPIAKKLLAKQ